MMDENCKVPVPINFNCWKHHSGFIRKQISLCKKPEDIETLKTILLKVGSSQMDLYFGKCSPQFISRSIIRFLETSGLLSEEKYNKWLKTDEKDYKLFRLTDPSADGSVWTLRFGLTPGRYVHIHPGRNSPHTIRVKALTLKTAVYVLCWKKINKIEKIDLPIINSLRKKYLNEPPLKKFSFESGLGKLLNLLGKLK